jgi:WD40 repeat protein
MHDGTICMWNISTGQLLEQFQGHDDGISSMVFVPDGFGFVTGSWDKTIKFWEIDSDVVREMTDEDRSIQATREGKSCAKCTCTLKGHNGIVLHVFVSPDGQWTASTSFDGSIMFWDTNGAPRLMMKDDHGNCRFTLLYFWQ